MGHRLIVMGLSDRVRDLDLYDLFDVFGPILDVEVARDARTGHALGYGYIDYARDSSVSRACVQMSGVTVAGSTLYCIPSPAGAPRERAPHRSGIFEIGDFDGAEPGDDSLDHTG